MKAIALILFALAGMAHAQHPLEKMAFDATTKCALVGAISIDQCQRLGARSAAQREATSAVRRLLTARFAFIETCAARDPYISCQRNADALMSVGVLRAAEAANLDSAPVAAGSMKYVPLP